MKIILISKDHNMVVYWKKYFSNYQQIIIVEDEISNFLSSREVKCIATPGNSFGIMGGGFDLGIKNFFGNEIEKKVQLYIKEHYKGIQPIASSFIIDINKKTKLIYTPTMIYPSKIKDYKIVYLSTLNSLKIARFNGINEILLPAFGASTGGLNKLIVAENMYTAINDFYQNN